MSALFLPAILKSCATRPLLSKRKVTLPRGTLCADSTNVDSRITTVTLVARTAFDAFALEAEAKGGATRTLNASSDPSASNNTVSARRFRWTPFATERLELGRAFQFIDMPA